MRHYINATAQLKDVELHGFWHRKREVLVITGITINGITAPTTTAFWLSVCQQLDMNTQVFRQGGPEAVLRQFLEMPTDLEFDFCLEEQEDGTHLFRAPRAPEALTENCRPNVPCRDASVPLTPRFNNDMFQPTCGSSEAQNCQSQRQQRPCLDPSLLMSAPEGTLRPSLN